MNRDELKQKWIEALRSGEYAQCKESIAKQGKLIPEAEESCDSFCCIGVLGIVVTGEKTFKGAHKGYTVLAHTLHISSGPLITMNDEEGKSFVQIADYLESLP